MRFYPSKSADERDTRVRLYEYGIATLEKKRLRLYERLAELNDELGTTEADLDDAREKVAKLVAEVFPKEES